MRQQRTARPDSNPSDQAAHVLAPAVVASVLNSYTVFERLALNNEKLAPSPVHVG
jgi:hypothetical protein